MTATPGEHGLVSVLKQLHDDLDTAVFDAYGWPRDLTDEQIREKTVALNAERAEEERRGLIRWPRPAFQNPSGGKVTTQTAIAEVEKDANKEAATAAASWSKKMAEQVAEVQDLLDRITGAWTIASLSCYLRYARDRNAAGPDGCLPIRARTVGLFSSLESSRDASPSPREPGDRFAFGLARPTVNSRSRPSAIRSSESSVKFVFPCSSRA